MRFRVTSLLAVKACMYVPAGHSKAAVSIEYIDLHIGTGSCRLVGGAAALDCGLLLARGRRMQLSNIIMLCRVTVGALPLC